jgi:hypothetical protein
MARKIFINYRRSEDWGAAQALYQQLESELPGADLFMDVEGKIKPGDDFVRELERQVGACDVLLAVIGPRWADLLAARVGDPGDFVVIEIWAALEQGKRVIPVLVGGAAMPRAETLPEPIRALARLNAVVLRPERFRADCEGLIEALDEHFEAMELEQAARLEAEHIAADAERRKRRAEAPAQGTAPPLGWQPPAAVLGLLAIVGFVAFQWQQPAPTPPPPQPPQASEPLFNPARATGPLTAAELEIAVAGSFAAVPGSTILSTSARRTATGTPPTTGSALSVSVLGGRSSRTRGEVGLARSVPLGQERGFASALADARA